jgi:hypothetical protein
MAKTIYSGLESSGKSLRLAMEADRLLYRNSSWFKKSGIMRPIASNLYFSESFEAMAKLLGIKIIYWKDLSELVLLENCDVIMDEVGNYFDARGWSELNLDVRVWLTQGAKCGVDIYGSAQDFAQVDKAFRRLTNNLYHIRKMLGSPRPAPTRPAVKRIWGVCYVRSLDPQGYDEDKFKTNSLIPSFFFIKKKYCEIFNTSQKILRSVPPPLKKVVRVCLEDGYKQIRYY